jgi:hypothetical protein
MRELGRVEGAATSAGSTIGRDLHVERDLCVRVLFDATRPVRAWLADDAGTKRGDAASGTSGAAPPRGPACAKKGEVIRFVVEGEPGTMVRAVIFAAP